MGADCRDREATTEPPRRLPATTPTGASEPILNRPWSSRSSLGPARSRVIGADFLPLPRYIGEHSHSAKEARRAEL